MAPADGSGSPGGTHVLADRIGYRFKDPALLDEAMAHRSWCAEQGGRTSNERLEFLGDAVLGLVVAEFTYRAHPELSDGAMSKVRASVVNTRVLGQVGLDLGYRREPAPRAGARISPVAGPRSRSWPTPPKR